MAARPPLSQWGSRLQAKTKKNTFCLFGDSLNWKLRLQRSIAGYVTTLYKVGFVPLRRKEWLGYQWGPEVSATGRGASSSHLWAWGLGSDFNDGCRPLAWLLPRERNSLFVILHFCYLLGLGLFILTLRLWLVFFFWTESSYKALAGLELKIHPGCWTNLPLVLWFCPGAWLYFPFIPWFMTKAPLSCLEVCSGCLKTTTHTRSVDFCCATDGCVDVSWHLSNGRQLRKPDARMIETFSQGCHLTWHQMRLWW